MTGIKCWVSPRTIGFCSLSLLSASLTWGQTKTRQPNIVFILLDDLAYDAIESSNRYPFLKTPHITQLQNEGMTFNNFFCTMSLSSPSRACFLTGVYPHIHGANQNDKRVDPNWQTYKPYTQLLQEGGYESAFIGKMHNAERWEKDQIRPGFDYWLGFRGQGDYFNPLLNENGNEFRAQGYITDLLTEYAEKWLVNKRDKTKPFSLCLWHKAVHMPFKPAERHLGCYANDTLPLPPNGNGVETFAGKPAWQRKKKSFDKIWDRDPEWNSHFKQPLDIMETLRAVDESLGNIMNTLKEMGELDRTILILAGDNGYFMGEHSYWDKRIAYEESMRIPLMIRYPHTIKPNSRMDEMCLNIDIAPTLLQMAGLKIPAYMQGASMLPLLKGNSSKWRDSFLFEYYVDDVYPYAGPTLVAIRTKEYKLVDCMLPDDLNELYNLKNDPGEMHNLIHDPGYKTIIKDLTLQIERLKKELKYNPDRDFWLRCQAPKWEKKHTSKTTK